MTHGQIIHRLIILLNHPHSAFPCCYAHRRALRGLRIDGVDRVFKPMLLGGYVLVNVRPQSLQRRQFYLS